jgi:hypothetical protein
MNVILDESALTVESADPLELLALFAVCAGRRHMLILNPRSKQQVNAWMDAHFKPQSALRRRVHQVLEINLRKLSNVSPDGAQITVVSGPTDWGHARLEPRHAVRLLQRPLRLLVENSRNDGAFLRLMAEPSDRRHLDEALRSGWIEYEMGGGLPEINHRLRRLAEASDDSTMMERARLWAMFDRDAHRDDRSRESENSGLVREHAARIRTPWPLVAHQLERRAIENYVPARTLRGWWCGQAETPKQKINRRQLVDAFLTEGPAGLPAKARRHYNMKQGLLNDVDKKRREEISRGGPPLGDDDLDPLFKRLDPTIRSLLADGGGFDDLADAFSTPGAIDETAFSEEVPPNERRRMLASLFKRM